MLGLSLGLSNLYVYTGQCGRAALIMIVDARLTVTLPLPSTFPLPIPHSESYIAAVEKKHC